MRNTSNNDIYLQQGQYIENVIHNTVKEVDIQLTRENEPQNETRYNTRNSKKTLEMTLIQEETNKESSPNTIPFENLN